MDIMEAYDVAAPVYAKKYDRIPARQGEVDHVLSFVDKKSPTVLEIGYGSGREAEYIIGQIYAKNYIGLDISKEMQTIAQKRLPECKFLRGDAMTAELGGSYDVVLAFASLLHLDEGQLSKVFAKVHAALNESGVFFLSLKRGEEYCSKVIDDGITTRRFWYYTREKLNQLSEGLFGEVFYDEQVLNQPWLTIILRKK